MSHGHEITTGTAVQQLLQLIARLHAGEVVVEQLSEAREVAQWSQPESSLNTQTHLYPTGRSRFTLVLRDPAQASEHVALGGEVVEKTKV